MNDINNIDSLAGILRGDALNGSHLETALGAATSLGLLLYQNNIGRLCDEELELHLFSRFGASLSNEARNISFEHQESINTLHVISEAYDIGGHTILLENVLKIESQNTNPFVAITKLCTPRFLRKCSALGVTAHQIGGNLSERAAAIISLGRKADQIVLHIHPEDIGSSLAARVLMDEGRYVAFVNHADHAFCFGHNSASVVAEVSGYGWRITAERRISRKQHFIGIPVPMPERTLSKDEVARTVRDGPIVSMGQAIKYKPYGFRSFPNFLMKLMDKTDRQVDLIGPTIGNPWWRPVLARHGDRLRLLGNLPYERAKEHLARSSCYVDSFPRVGGTAFTQGLMSGKTAFGLDNPAGGYSLADELRTPDVDELVEQIVTFLNSGVEPKQVAKVRSRIAAEFGEQAFGYRLKRLKEGATDPPPPELFSAAVDLDYHHDLWRHTGRPIFSLRPLANPSFTARARIATKIANDGEIQKPRLRSLIRWAAFGAPSD